MKANLFALILFPVALLAGCAAEGATGAGGNQEPSPNRHAVAGAEGAGAREGDHARAGAGGSTVMRTSNVVSDNRRGDTVNDTSAGEVTLELGGDPGVELSGSCRVGGEETKVSGRVPQSFTFDLRGRKLECEIRKRGAGGLEVVLEAGNNSSAQRIDSSGDTTIVLVYDKGSVSVLQSSGSTRTRSNISGSSSINQQITSD